MRVASRCRHSGSGLQAGGRYGQCYDRPVARRRLPIGIQSFRKIREDGAYYVDKTPFIERLLGDGTHYFLSRPRRFGKSLFVDTLKELFEGSEELFKGLAIHGGWDWSVRNPVVRLDFSSGSFASVDDLHAEVADQLDVVAAEAGVELAGRTAPIRFRQLIRELHGRTGQRVVVLVAEYDKPILDVLEDPGSRQGQPQLPAWAVFDLEARRRARPPELHYRGEQVLRSLQPGSARGLPLAWEGESVFGFEQPHGHHARSGVLGDRRLHGRRSRRSVRAGTAGPRPREDPRVVQRLLMARRGEGLQPLRHPAAVPQPRVQGALDRDRLADVPSGPAVPAAGALGGLRRHAGERRAAVHLRRGRYRAGSAAVPNRLPDNPRARAPRRNTHLPVGLSEPGGAPGPEPQPSTAAGTGRESG